MQIHAFRGWRYAAGGEDAGPFIAPPYDVLSQADKDRLLARSDHNIVAVDLPHCPAHGAGPDEVYAAAAKRLTEWQGRGVLVQETAPALYAYQQSYRWAGVDYVRRAMICGVRATELGVDVIGHEKTHAGPKADRLELTRHTHMQLSPIFGFYNYNYKNDPAGRAAELLWSAIPATPVVKGRLGEVDEKLWAVTDQAVIEQIAAALADVPAFIADGHHRYTTALNYRDELLAAGRIDEDNEANFVMFALVPRDDPGLLVLPTHRLFSGLAGEFSAAKLTLTLTKNSQQFTWVKQDRSGLEPNDIEAALAEAGRGAIGLIDSVSTDLWVGQLADTEAMAAAAPDQIDAWRSLDVAILHELIVGKSLAEWRTDEYALAYTARAADVVDACDAGRAQLGALLQAVPLAAVEQIARAGASMPQKSTYFYPKLATGMVLKPLE